ncbi:hypothetical protein [Amycolatopsis sp. NPDC049868]|uniref:hypothetical protein n=1 Tax=Amycolatopsis sp. NPDC049868 TaxID=3363934 RepID=UPI0037B4E043
MGTLPAALRLWFLFEYQYIRGAASAIAEMARPSPWDASPAVAGDTSEPDGARDVSLGSAETDALPPLGAVRLLYRVCGTRGARRDTNVLDGRQHPVDNVCG